MSDSEKGGRERRWLHTSQVKEAGAELEITKYFLRPDRTAGELAAYRTPTGTSWVCGKPGGRSFLKIPESRLPRKSGSGSLCLPAVQGPRDILGDTELRLRRRQSYRVQVFLALTFSPPAVTVSRKVRVLTPSWAIVRN